MKVLFLGDIIGRAGRTAIQSNLKSIQKSNQIDFTIVNGENSAGGFGITENICKDLYSYGCDVITTGNHLWDQKEISDYIERDNKPVKQSPYQLVKPENRLTFWSRLLLNGYHQIVRPSAKLSLQLSIHVLEDSELKKKEKRGLFLPDPFRL